MDSNKLNRKIFDWAGSNSNGRCQNLNYLNYRVNKMLEEAGLQYQPGITNPAILKRNLSDYLSQKFLDTWSEDVKVPGTEVDEINCALIGCLRVTMKLKTTLTVLCLISIGVPLLNSVVE